MYMMIWIVIIFLLTLIDLITVNLTTVWFIFGAIVALVLNNYKFNFLIQFLSFAGIGLLLYLFVKPHAEEAILKKRLKYFNNSITGRKGKVTRNILPKHGGEVIVGGKRFSAVSNELIRRNDEIKVKENDGLTLIVEKTKKSKKAKKN